MKKEFIDLQNIGLRISNYGAWLKKGKVLVPDKEQCKNYKLACNTVQYGYEGNMMKHKCDDKCFDIHI